MERLYLYEPATASVPGSLWDYSTAKAVQGYTVMVQVLFEDGTVGLLPQHLVERFKEFNLLAGEF
jgi:hypothetical protein